VFDVHAFIESYGDIATFAVAAIIFIETAFIVTSFLPGDSLLFVLGIALAPQGIGALAVALIVVTAAAIAGAFVGYLTGRAIGPALFERRNTWFFNPTFVERAHHYFDRFGPRAFILARFIPVIRALVPMVAGISRVDLRTATLYNAIGAVIWVFTLVIGGFTLGDIPVIHDNIETAIIVVVIVTSLPFPLELFREYLQRRKA